MKYEKGWILRYNLRPKALPIFFSCFLIPTVGVQQQILRNFLAPPTMDDEVNTNIIITRDRHAFQRPSFARNPTSVSVVRWP